MMGPNIIRKNLNQAINYIERCKEHYVKNPGKDFTRQRKISMEDVLKFTIMMEGGSLKKEIYQYVKTTTVNFTSSAYIQQRSKLLVSAFRDSLHQFNQLCDDMKTFNGYYVYAADGSYINVYTNPNEKDSYIQSLDNIKGYNLLELHALYDLKNCTYKDAIILPAKKSNERVALQEMLKQTHFDKKSIIIVDRGYEGYNMFAHFMNTPNVDFVCRVKQETPLKPLKHLPMCEVDQDISFEITRRQTNEDKANHRIYLGQPSKKGNSPKTVIQQWDFSSPYQFNLRVVRVKIDDEKYETIITSLPRDKFPIESIKKLYQMRWGIETSFRALKYTIGLTHLHSKKEEFVCQEIYAKLLMFNFSQRIVGCIELKQKSERKYMYQVNYTMAVSICRDFYRNGKSFSPIAEQLKAHIEPIRPGRTGKRNSNIKRFVPFVYRVAA